MTEYLILALVPVVIVAATVAFFHYRSIKRRRLARSNRPIHVQIKSGDTDHGRS